MQPRVRFVLVAIVLIAAVLAAGFYFFRSNSSGNTLVATGTIEATEVDVSFQISGRVSEILVREGQPVEANTVIARMSSEELQNRVRQIEASLAAISSQVPQQQVMLELKQALVDDQIQQARSQADAARAAVTRLRAGARPQEIRVAEAALAQAEAELQRRTNDFGRMSRLFEKQAVSQMEYDATRSAFLSAETAVQAARERLELAREGPRKEEIEEAEARLRAAQAGVGIAESARREIEIQQQVLAAARARVRELVAQLETVRTQLGYTEIRAPIAGVVLLKNTEAGEVVNPGTPVVTVGDIDNLWMNVYIPETKSGLVRLGQLVRVRVDSFPDETFAGRVTFISSEAEFTPRTIQTQEERVKLVYRVKVSLENTNQKLKPGMPADAAIVLKEGPE